MCRVGKGSRMDGRQRVVRVVVVVVEVEEKAGGGWP